MIGERHLADWEEERSALPPSTLWAATPHTHTHTVRQENKLLSVGLTCVFAVVILVTPQILRNPESWAERRRRWGCQRLPDADEGLPRCASRAPGSHPFISVALTVCAASRGAAERYPRERRNPLRAIFHHYVLHFLINEIQRMQTARLVDHHLRENHRPNCSTK